MKFMYRVVTAARRPQKPYQEMAPLERLQSRLKYPRESMPEELASRPYTFVVQAGNNTWHDDVIRVVCDHGGLYVYAQQYYVPEVDRTYNSQSGVFAVSSPEDYDAIVAELKSGTIVINYIGSLKETDWSNYYNITIDDYSGSSGKRIKYHCLKM